MFDIPEELKKLPGKPGVYIMHDETDMIIYVGKAISLKNRVRQYFQSSRNKGAKIEQMVTHIRRFEYIVTDSELEALVLECNLIKEHHPKYNTMLMDDKAYPFIKVTADEAYPRIMLARKMIKDKAKYFGPYTSAGAVKDTIELIRKLYHIRSCNRKLPRDTGKERPCLNYHIHQCDAPCQGYISQEAYQKSVQEVLHFLNGNYDIILKRLEKQMQDAAEVLEFEKAAEYRELIVQCAEDCAEAEDHGHSRRRQRRYCYGDRICRCGRAGFFYPWRQTDRKRSFLFKNSAGRDRKRNTDQLYQTVLCRNTVYSFAAYASAGSGRPGTSGRVAEQEKGTESPPDHSEKRGRKRSLLNWLKRMPPWYYKRTRNG